jgi:hypothetical protein
MLGIIILMLRNIFVFHIQSETYKRVKSSTSNTVFRVVTNVDGKRLQTFSCKYINYTGFYL